MIDNKSLDIVLGHVGKWAALAEEWQTKCEEAEAEVKRLRETNLTPLQQRAREAERQRDEAFAKGAEAMREACAMAAWMIGMGFGMDESDARACASAIRALPIPTQEK